MKRLVRAFTVVAGLAAVAGIVMFGFLGLRMQVGGDGMPQLVRPINWEEHYAQLERERAEQKRQAQNMAGGAGQTGGANQTGGAEGTLAGEGAPGGRTETNGSAAEKGGAKDPAAAGGSASELAKAAGQAQPGLAAEGKAAGQPASNAGDAAAASVGSPASAPWPAYRGASRDGIYRQSDLSGKWANKLTELWRHPIGGGYASFAIAEGKLFTIEQRRDKETIAAYDAKTGRELWADSYPALFSESMGGDGPRTTPTYDAGRIYALGAEGELRCLQADSGKLVWRKNVLEDASADNISWGMAGSPLVVDNLVVVQPGGARNNSIIAYDRLTGKRVWGSLGDKTAYVSPMLMNLGGRRQIVTLTALRAVGLDVATGKLLWEHPWVTEYDVNAAQPLAVGANRVFLSSGYGHGATVVELTAAADGYSVKTIWENKKMKNKFSSSVLYNGYIYGLDEGILACIQADTGEQKWKGGRYGHGQVLLAGQHLLITTEQGDVAIAKANPNQHEELLRFSAMEGRTWNTPAIAGGVFFVRNLREMVAYKL